MVNYNENYLHHSNIVNAHGPIKHNALTNDYLEVHFHFIFLLIIECITLTVMLR